MTIKLIKIERRIRKHLNIYEKNKMETVVIYTDGACSGNPGPGGRGAILMYKDIIN